MYCRGEVASPGLGSTGFRTGVGDPTPTAIISQCVFKIHQEALGCVRYTLGEPESSGI